MSVNRGKRLRALPPEVYKKKFLDTVMKFSYVDDNGCWRWVGYKSKMGYGYIKYMGKTTTAHRAAYMALVGDFDTSLEVCHACDVPDCVNPNHLFLGTHYENMKDMQKKGRAAGRLTYNKETLRDQQGRFLKIGVSHECK